MLARGRLAIVPAALTLAWLAAPAALSAQVPIGRATTTPLGFDTFGGTGFGSLPTTGQLDSLLWVPVGNSPPDPGPTAFGGRCEGPALTTVCARGVATGVTPLLPGIYAVSSVFRSGTALGLQSGSSVMPALRPGGVRLRLRNADSIPIRRMQIRLAWGSRRVTMRPTADFVAVHAVQCDGTSRGPTLPIVAIGPGSSISVWDSHDDTYEIADAAIAPGADACFELLVGEEGGDRDLVAIDRVEIIVPSALCGNGLVETGEDCDSGGTTGGECECDPVTCRLPSDGTPCEDGDDNPCTGACSLGGCHGADVYEGEFVDACDDTNPCTFDGCRSGECAVLDACDAIDACTSCDPVAHSCGRIGGCCVTSADCAVDIPCAVGVCNAATTSCEIVVEPTCDASLVDGGTVTIPDAGPDEDASVPPPDGSTPPRDSGTTTDGSSASMDAGSGELGTTARFGGGGGCRCAAAGTGAPAGSAWLLGIAWLAARLAKRRRI